MWHHLSTSEAHNAEFPKADTDKRFRNFGYKDGYELYVAIGGEGQLLPKIMYYPRPICHTYT